MEPGESSDLQQEQSQLCLVPGAQHRETFGMLRFCKQQEKLKVV